jgi:16S rRNA (cytosine967-C5)-methyltransferase
MALDARAAAARIVAKVLLGKSLNQVMPGLLTEVPDRDQGLAQQLSYGTLRQFHRLKAVLDQLIDKPLRAKDGDVSALLLVGLYQLDALRVPDHAAVATTVEATKALGKPWAKGLANAVLRRFLRERESLLAGIGDAAGASHPKWLYKKIHKQWPQAAASILRANNGQPPMSLRVNSRMLTAEAYLDKLLTANIAARPSTLCPQGVRLEQPMDVNALPGFTGGEASVQDEAAQLAAVLLGTQAGERVLDACSAPGGKACHILELQPALSELVAADVDGQRLEKVVENLDRLKLKATLLTIDAAAPAGLIAPDSFDRILVDAPCSASGVIRRHPDVKVLRRPEDIESMAAQQLEILLGLWPALKPGGLLLYATCSIFDEENSQVVEKFLQQQPDAQHEIPAGSWGEVARYGRQLLPSDDGPDGLFYCFLGKAR